MKWFLIGLAAVVCSTTWVRGQDAAAILYKQGADAMSAEQYDIAVKDFDQILDGYPNTPNIDDIRVRDGFAYLHLGNFTKAVDQLAKEILPTADPAFRGTALYFTGLAQFSQGQKLAGTDKTGSNKAMLDAANTLTELCKFITANPSPDNNDMMEDAIYYRGLAQYQREDYSDAEKDLLILLQTYPASLKRPDYLLLLGSLYAVETNQMVETNNDPKTTVPKTPEEIKAMAQKALDAFNQVSNDPNALVQANDANMSKAEVLYLIAQLDAPATEGYQKALDAFRQVRRKQDMVELQQARLEELKKKSAAALVNGGAGLANANSRLIDREEGRLTELQNGPDPIIQAMVRMAECYISLKQPDEARTVLRRLIAHAYANLPPDLQQEVDFQLLYSYVLGGQTDQADQGLTAYLAKHPADPQADIVSFQIASTLMQRKDFTGALAQADRSLKEFPNGRYVSNVLTLKESALRRLGRMQEANDVLTQLSKLDLKGPLAIQTLLEAAQGKVAAGDLAGALDLYKSVMENKQATDEMRAAASAGHIQVLQAMQKYDNVIAEAKDFAANFPNSTALPGVMVYSALAMDKKGDAAGAVATFQDEAKKYPKDDSSSFALFYVVDIYRRANNVPAMVQAAKDLAAAYPTAYTFLGDAADYVSAVYLKQKEFVEAIALYQPLLGAPKHEVAAAAQNKIGDIWLTAAKALGAYQSMQVAARKDAENRLASGEAAYLATLKNFPDQVDAVGNAFEGLTNTLKQRRSWGLLTDADLEGNLGKLTAGLASPEMSTRVELANAGLVFIYKNGAKQYPMALDRFRKAISASPGLLLTRQEADQYGELLLAAKDYPTALQVYQDLLDHAQKNDEVAQADGYYGLGATYLAQGDMAKAADNFTKMTALPGGAGWNPHIEEAQFGLALAAEQAGDPQGLAKQTYARLMQSASAGIPLQSKAMLGYGRLLEKAGFVVKPAPQGPNEFAIHYYLEADTIFGPAVPEQSAEGLFDAGQAYVTIGDKANAQAQFKKLIATYAAPAPDWVAKAQAAAAKLGP